VPEASATKRALTSVLGPQLNKVAPARSETTTFGLRAVLFYGKFSSPDVSQVHVAIILKPLDRQRRIRLAIIYFGKKTRMTVELCEKLLV
jgi:hypothetical protein